MLFTEPWCTDLEKGAIEASWNKVKDLDGLVVEIGCFEGRSSVFTANLIHSSGDTLICIDPWVPVAYADAEIRIYSERPIFEHFTHNMKHGTAGNYEVNVMPYEQYFETFDESQKIKYLYLDGPHGYPDVQLGLRTVLPFMAEGGIILGDNYEDHAVKTAVNDFFGVADLTHSESERTFEWVNI